MRLTVATPLGVVVDRDDVVHVRAEDETGAFGILPGHAPFLTALAISVVSWRDHAGREGHVAVRGGVLRVRRGSCLEVASREAVAGDNLEQLESDVLARFRAEAAVEQAAWQLTARLEVAALRQVRRALRPDRERRPPAMTTVPAAEPGTES